MSRPAENIRASSLLVPVWQSFFPLRSLHLYLEPVDLLNYFHLDGMNI